VDIFKTIATYWNQLAGPLQTQLMPFWKTLLGLPVIGDALKWIEETLGRGATPLD